MKIIILMIVIIMFGCESKYEQAKKSFDSGDEQNSKSILITITSENKDFKASQDLLSKIQENEDKSNYKKGVQAFLKKKLILSRKFFDKINNKGDSAKFYLGKLDSIKDYKMKERERLLKEKRKIVQKFIGKKYKYPESLTMIDKYGSPETLKGTNNSQWNVYFPKGDFTFAIKKSTNIIEYGEVGKVDNIQIPINIVEETKKLFKLLIKFKGKRDFHRYGFAPAYKYHNWLNNVDYYSAQPEAKQLLKRGFVLGDLRMLGMEYMQTKGKENEYTRFTRKAIQNGLRKKR